MIWCHLIFRPTTHLVPYWDIFSFWLRFVDLHWFAWSYPFTRYMSSWWSAFILRWFPSGIFLKSFGQAHTLWYCRISMKELSLVSTLPYHHFSGVHVRSLIHPHRVILELSGHTRCTSCYTGVYFPLLVVKMIVFSQTCYNLLYLVKGCLFALLVTVSMIFAEMSLQRSTTFEFWLSYYPWLFRRLLCWDRSSYPSRLFFWDSLVDHSFEITMDSSSRAFWVRGVWLIVTHHQASLFS